MYSVVWVLLYCTAEKRSKHFYSYLGIGKGKGQQVGEGGGRAITGGGGGLQIGSVHRLGARGVYIA